MTCDLQSLNWELSDLKPPIPRDRLIFEEVLVKGRGQLEVAQEQGISQPRVSKILAEVVAWLCRVLPESAAKETPEGQLALGFWLAKARLDFLYHKALVGYDASGQDKVVVKQGKRGDVAWEETSSTTQTRKAGFINSALRAVLATSRLCTGAAKSSGNVRRASPAIGPSDPVMSNFAKGDEQTQAQPPQTPTVPAFATGADDATPHSEAVIKKVMEIARENPKRADWTEAELRYAAEMTLAKLDVAIKEQEERRKEKAAAKQAKAEAKAARAAAAIPPIPEPAVLSMEAIALPLPKLQEAEPLSLSAVRIEKLRREREKRRSPQERRREFLAPLAAG